MKKELIKISKFLSFILRHNKDKKFGVVLDKNGWADVSDILKAVKTDAATLSQVVITNDKQRFTFNGDGTKIRANQGHSIEIDLNLKPRIPPLILYHGTVEKFLGSIFGKGLIKGERQHVHLSKGTETAYKVGERRGKPVILIVDAKKMYEDGYDFFFSKNKVWLTDHVPPSYIEIKC